MGDLVHSSVLVGSPRRDQVAVAAVSTSASVARAAHNNNNNNNARVVPAVVAAASSSSSSPKFAFDGSPAVETLPASVPASEGNSMPQFVTLDDVTCAGVSSKLPSQRKVKLQLAAQAQVARQTAQYRRVVASSSVAKANNPSTVSSTAVSASQIEALHNTRSLSAGASHQALAHCRALEQARHHHSVGLGQQQEPDHHDQVVQSGVGAAATLTLQHAQAHRHHHQAAAYQTQQQQQQAVAWSNQMMTHHLAGIGYPHALQQGYNPAIGGYGANAYGSHPHHAHHQFAAHPQVAMLYAAGQHQHPSTMIAARDALGMGLGTVAGLGSLSRGAPSSRSSAETIAALVEDLSPDRIQPEDAHSFIAISQRHSDPRECAKVVMRYIRSSSDGRELLLEMGANPALCAPLRWCSMCNALKEHDAGSCPTATAEARAAKREKQRKRNRKINGMYIVPELLRNLVQSYGGYVACFGDGRHASTSKWSNIVREMGIPVKKRLRNGRLVDKGKEAATLRRLYCLWFPEDLRGVPDKYIRHTPHLKLSRSFRKASAASSSASQSAEQDS